MLSSISDSSVLLCASEGAGWDPFPFELGGVGFSGRILDKTPVELLTRRAASLRSMNMAINPWKLCARMHPRVSIADLRLEVNPSFAKELIVHAVNSFLPYRVWFCVKSWYGDPFYMGPFCEF